MIVAFQRMFRILERWNNNQVAPSLSKPHELSYRSNIYAGIGNFSVYILYPLKLFFIPKKLQSTISCTNSHLNFILRHLILTFQNVFLVCRDLRYVK